MNRKNNIVILGPTATGKTRLAAMVAEKINGEVISADSRQVYKGMDLGTGKDLLDYEVNGITIPSHLIDIVDAGSHYNIFDYSRDFNRAALDIMARDKNIVVCGGSGMYIEAALGLYRLKETPEDEAFRRESETMTDDELIRLLKSLRPLHNITDTTDRNRLIRAIEIARAENLPEKENTGSEPSPVSAGNSLIFGVEFLRSEVRQRITERLEERMKNGMLNEVKLLLNTGLNPKDLTYYGLEYKYITLHLTGELSYDEMFSLLNTAIHQFAKRQMTWFRRMERKGISIHWLDGKLSPEENAELVQKLFNNF
jgi:tRNA dimethylallyltransferase